MILGFIIGFGFALALLTTKFYFSKQYIYNKGFRAGVEGATSLFKHMEFKLLRYSHKEGIYVQGTLAEPVYRSKNE